MRISDLHKFHIPVMGLGYTIDTPIKIAKYGIDSVISIIDDETMEKLREYLCAESNLKYEKIDNTHEDYKAKRVTEYLNLLNQIVKKQIQEIKNQDFDADIEINNYFEFLPDTSTVKQFYNRMKSTVGAEKFEMQQKLREVIKAGSLDVNIMTKVDRPGFDSQGNKLPPEFSGASNNMRGFANSELESALVFSAGMSPRLYSYCEQFKDFFPDENGKIKKRIILKVSDYRSALIQGKLFAKKGLWLSEFRIESGINCGGHTFISDGILLGPILEEFKKSRYEMYDILLAECNKALTAAGKNTFTSSPVQTISVQGGVGTAEESNMFLEKYGFDAVGWGSPFLLVPEVTNVDDYTLHALATAQPEDYFLSEASPLGVLFNNFRKSSAENQRKERTASGIPGSPCVKKHLALNTEFTDVPICAASRQYQKLKTEQINNSELSDEEKKTLIDALHQKDCLCEGLTASALIKNGIAPRYPGVTVCPGPNLAFFSGVFTLKQMIDHIYGRINLLNTNNRPHVFVNELQLYVDYLIKELTTNLTELNAKKVKYYENFKQNLLDGIDYCKAFFKELKYTPAQVANQNLNTLNSIKEIILGIKVSQA